MSTDVEKQFVATIKVIGVGGAGNNAVNRMAKEHMEGVEFWAVNTDAQVLFSVDVENKITLGENITKGLGAGARPDVGKQAAEASLDALKNAIRGADMVFIAAGMGGGTGTGASPVIARLCREMGCLTIGIVTRPFTFEGKVRNEHAVEGLQKLRQNVDSLIVISNDQLLQMSGDIPLSDSFGQADDILCHSVKTITELILQPAIINLDFADVRNIMLNKGTALIGMGRGRGDNMAREAAEQAVSSPLLEASISGARNAIVNIKGGRKMTLLDANEAVEIVREAAGDSDINVIFGVSVDQSLDDEMLVTVIATEFVGGDIHKVSHPNITGKGSMTLDLGSNQIQRVDSEIFKNAKKKGDENQFFSPEKEAGRTEPLADDDSMLPAFLRRRNN
ncbi:cell division protein FtsZ [bacterium]|jgi:cell division protein FtsZ|nr:cell division protein FtsZ [bacterium]